MNNKEFMDKVIAKILKMFEVIFKIVKGAYYEK